MTRRTMPKNDWGDVFVKVNNRFLTDRLLLFNSLNQNYIIPKANDS